MATAIKYSLTPVSENFTGGAKVYRANVLTNGTIDIDQLAEDLADRTKQDKALISYFLTSLNNVLRDRILSGYRINLGQLSTGFSIKGSFLSEDDRFDAARHQVQPTIRALDPLKSALGGIDVKNITVGLTCTVNALMDMQSKALNVIGSNGEMHIQGVNLGIDTDNLDEGVTLVDDDGVVKATATIISSDAQTIACSFASLPEDGAYTLVVSCRNGARASLAPAVGRLKNVLVQVNA